jgi:hypothetical protein
VPSPDTPGTNLAGILANSPTDMYAFGFESPDDYDFDTLVVHWDGSVWTPISSPNPTNNPTFTDNQLLPGVVSSPGNVWILGQQYGSRQGPCNSKCTRWPFTAVVLGDKDFGHGASVVVAVNLAFIFLDLSVLTLLASSIGYDDVFHVEH